MFKRYYIIVSIMLYLTYSGFCQQSRLGKPIVENYTFLEYQAGLQNWAVIQDHREIVYVGNRFGILEYDGFRWNLIELEKKTIGRSLAIDSTGKIFVGGQGEFGYLQPDSIGQLVYVPLWHELPEAFQSFEDVWRIHILPEAVVFSTVRALFIYAQTGIKVVTPTTEEHLFDRAYYCEGRLFVQEIGTGLLEWKNERLELVSGGKQFATSVIKEILPHPNGELLILTFSDGIFRFSNDQILPWEVPVNGYAKENFVYSAIRLREGAYAVGTSEQGLLLFDEKGNIQQTLDRFDGLQNNTVLSLWQDVVGNLWLGLDNGLAYVEINSPFSQLSGYLDLQGTPYTSTVWEEQLFLGTTNGVFHSKWNTFFDPLDHPSFELLKNTKGQAYQLLVVRDQLLLAHHNGAFAIRNNEVVRISETEGAWTFLELKNHPGYMIGGTYTGLDLYHNEPSGWRFLRHFPSFSESSRMMEQDSLGDIWIAHGNKGVFRIQLADDLEKIETVRHYNSADGFPSDIFISVHKVMGELIFTAEKGVYVYDAKSDRFVIHEVLNDLFGADAYVRTLVEDTWSRIWYQSDDEFGMLRIVDSGFQKEIKRISVDKLKGKLLAGYEHIRPYAVDGVLIGTQEGFIHFDPTYSPNHRPGFQTIIRDVSTLSRPEERIFGGAFQDKSKGVSSQQNDQKFTIPARSNSIRIEFAAPYYEDADKMLYSHKLEGFEKGWSKWSTTSSKEYTNIPEGDYTFLVKARNIYQQESLPGEFRFSILQPWYKNRIALIFYSCLIVAFVVWMFFHNNRRLENEKQYLKVQQAQALKMKEEAFFAQSTKSEEEIMRLRNEKLQAEIAHKTRELTSSAIHLVQKGEILLKIKQELEKLLPDVGASERSKLNKLIKVIGDDIKLDKNWEKFEYHFDSVHENFLKRLREHYPALSPKDQKLCAYLRMNLSTKEIAPLMNISVRGVEISRYRLRKKMNLESGTNLVELLLQIN